MADPPADRDLWRELAQRLLTHHMPGGPEFTATVSVAALPAAWEEAIPIPDGWRLIGSAARGYANGQVARVDVVFDAEGKSKELLEDYAAQLVARGWSPYEEPAPMHDGFTASAVVGARRSFRRDDTVVHVTAIERRGAPCDVRVLADTEHIRRHARFPEGRPPGMDLMPNLQVPDGVALSPRGGGGGPDHYETSAVASTSMPLDQLEAFLAGQLEAAGWTTMSRRADDVTAWSAWQLPDAEWRALLVLLRPFDNERVSLSMHIERAGDDDSYGYSGYALS